MRTCTGRYRFILIRLVSAIDLGVRVDALPQDVKDILAAARDRLAELHGQDWEQLLEDNLPM